MAEEGLMSRAQMWHMTDHGVARKPASRDTRFRTPAPEPAPAASHNVPSWVESYSTCFCCCPLCDPATNTERPNPFWTPVIKVWEND